MRPTNQPKALEFERCRPYNAGRDSQGDVQEDDE